MKKTFTIQLFAMVICLAGMLNISFAQQPAVQGKLEYMMQESSDKVFEIAQKENKPVLIYIHSQSCFSSKKFSREIMNNSKVKALIRKKYICMNADVSSKIGQQMASKFGVLMMPGLFLVTPDRGIEYQCKLSVDTFDMMTQFRSFITVCNLQEQVKMQKSTSELSEKEIIRQIGRSYAMKDYQKDKTSTIGLTLRVTTRTLNIPFFKEFEIGYMEEWNGLLASNKGKSQQVTEAASTK